MFYWIILLIFTVFIDTGMGLAPLEGLEPFTWVGFYPGKVSTRPEKRLASHTMGVRPNDTPAGVSFQWKNPDFLSKNPDFLFRNPDFLLKNVDFIMKNRASRCC